MPDIWQVTIRRRRTPGKDNKMIFNFTAKERKLLYDLEFKKGEALEKWAKIAEKHGALSEPAQIARREYMTYYKDLAAEFDAVWDSIEQEHFLKLKSPAEILEDAKQQAQDAIIYVFLRIWANATEDMRTGKHIVVGMENGVMRTFLGKWDFEEDIEQQKRAGFDPKEASFLLDATGLQIYIEKDILSRHIEAMKGLPEEKALQDALEEIIDASPYTTNEPIKEDAAPLLDINKLMRNPLSDITIYGLMNDKVNAQLIQGDFFTQEANGQLTIRFAVDQAPKNQKQAAVYMALTYEGTEGKLTKRLTAFDSAVYNAVATRFYYWQQENINSPLYITPQEIWRTMNGKKSGDGKAKPGKAQLQRICDSLDKMRFTRLYMDISEEIQAFNLYIDDDRVTERKIDTYVLNCSKVEFKTEKGNVIQGYKIGDEPILYTYNRVKKHILYVPYEMLDTSTNTSDSENVTEFRNYLLQQIQLMKNALEGKGKYYNRNRIILLETIYRDTGILPPEERIKGDYANETTRQQLIRRTRKADREKIEGILEAWKAKKWIRGYIILNKNNEPLKEKQQAKGYEITL